MIIKSRQSRCIGIAYFQFFNSVLLNLTQVVVAQSVPSYPDVIQTVYYRYRNIERMNMVAHHQRQNTGMVIVIIDIIIVIIIMCHIIKNIGIVYLTVLAVAHQVSISKLLGSSVGIQGNPDASVFIQN